MAEHPIQGLMNVTMDKIRQMADSNTIIGKPIKTDDGTTILPVSRISFGFASAGTDFDGKNAANKDLFGGGYGNSTVQAYGNSTVKAYDNSYINCRSTIECVLKDNSIVRKWDTNTIQYVSDNLKFEKKY